MLNFPDSPTEGQIFTAGAGSWMYAAGRWLASPAAAQYIIGCYVPGTLTASQILLVHRFSRAVIIPANFGAVIGYASQASGTAATTASTVIVVAKALAASPTTFSDIGTITFAAGGTTPTFATTGATFAQGDVFRLTGPAVADATFAGFSATLAMQET